MSGGPPPDDIRHRFPLSFSGAAENMKIYVELSKPRVTGMVVLTTALSYGFALTIALDAKALLAAVTSLEQLALLALLLIGTALVSGGASALNMWLERGLDAGMERTAQRPLPSGRLQPAFVFAIGILQAVLGTVFLWMGVGSLTALIGVATLLIYVLVYTPLKVRTHWATHIGTLPGAMPVLMGWAAYDNRLDAPGWALFAVLLIWQLPHFFAINWMYRDEYRDAGFRMLATVDQTGRRLAVESVLFVVLLFVVALSPPLLAHTGTLYLLVALLAGAAFFWAIVRFAAQRTKVRARAALLVSVIYLPAVFSALVVDRLWAVWIQVR